MRRNSVDTSGEMDIVGTIRDSPAKVGPGPKVTVSILATTDSTICKMRKSAQGASRFPSQFIPRVQWGELEGADLCIGYRMFEFSNAARRVYRATVVLTCSIVIRGWVSKSRTMSPVLGDPKPVVYNYCQLLFLCGFGPGNSSLLVFWPASLLWFSFDS